MLFKRKNENDSIKLEEEKNIIKSCNSLVLSNSIILIPLVYAIIEAVNKLSSVRTLTIIFGLILVGCLLVSNFLAMLANMLNKSKKELMFVSYLLSSSIYLLLFIFIMVIMIVL